MEEKDTDRITHPLNTTSGSLNTSKPTTGIKASETALTLGEQSDVENTVTFDRAFGADTFGASFSSSTLKPEQSSNVDESSNLSTSNTNPHVSAQTTIKQESERKTDTTTHPLNSLALSSGPYKENVNMKPNDSPSLFCGISPIQYDIKQEVKVAENLDHCTGTSISRNTTKKEKDSDDNIYSRFNPNVVFNIIKQETGKNANAMTHPLRDPTVSQSIVKEESDMRGPNTTHFCSDMPDSQNGNKQVQDVEAVKTAVLIGDKSMFQNTIKEALDFRPLYGNDNEDTECMAVKTETTNESYFADTLMLQCRSENITDIPQRAVVKMEKAEESTDTRNVLQQREDSDKYMEVKPKDKPIEQITTGGKFSNSRNVAGQDNDKQRTLVSKPEINQFLCVICKESFATQYRLSKHKISDHGPEPHECSECGKKFVTASNLKQHMVTHTGERNYECNVCLRTFSQSNSLSAHIKIHTGEKNHECGECGKNFIAKSEVKRHKKIHQKHECHVCGEKCTNPRTLTKHIKIKHNKYRK